MLQQDIQRLLKERFGFDQFRGQQQEIIAAALEGKSSLVLMPTGMGKSLCYQVPAVYGEGLVLVVSPLIALMQDQVIKAKKLNIRAAAIHSALSKEEREQRIAELGKNKFQLLYVTPERFRKTDFLQALSQNKIKLMAIDEAHCISQWGHDFRPDYSRLGEVRKQLGMPTVMALTATATKEVQSDILAQLDIQQTSVFRSGIERANLQIRMHEVVGLDEKIRLLVGLAHQNPGAQIIYFSLISTLQKTSAELARLNIRHLVYHGELAAGERGAYQKRFIEQDRQMILATPAFGLGVDKPDVRLLVHMEVPGSIEAYYQEIGRAGRDGLTSQCHLFYDKDDLTTQMEFIKWANPDRGFILRVYDLIKDNKLRIEQEGNDFLREQMNYYNRRDFRVETALNLLERIGALEKVNSRFGFRIVDGFDFSNYGDFFNQKLIESRIKNQNQKLLDIVRLCEMSKGCRMQAILEYFADAVEPCGHCDLCESLK